MYIYTEGKRKKNEDSVPRIETQDRLYVRNLNHTRWEKLEILSRLQVGRVANTVVSRALTSIVIYLFYAIHEKKFLLCTFHRFPCQIVLSIVIVFSATTIPDRRDTFAFWAANATAEMIKLRYTQLFDLASNRIRFPSDLLMEKRWNKSDIKRSICVLTLELPERWKF